MDTTAAAELGVGGVGAGVDGVGFWEWGAGGGEQQAWPEDDHLQQPTIPEEEAGGRSSSKFHPHSKRHNPPPPLHPKRARPSDEPPSYPPQPSSSSSSPFHGFPLEGHAPLSPPVLLLPPPSAPFSAKPKGTGSIFFKTKLCIKFKSGTCPYNSSCTFAHGNEELRQPPPDWKDVVAAAGQDTERERDRAGSRGREGQGNQAGFTSQSGYKTRPCKRYYTEEGCPYGDRCIFLHDDQGSQARSGRESNAISLGPAPGVGNGGVGGATNGCGNWKNRICNKWETTGHCPFGQKCHFAHSFSDAHVSSSNPRHGGVAVSSQYQRQITDSESKWKNPANEISTIYGDWIEDDEWEYITSSSLDAPLLDGRKDVKALPGQQVKQPGSNQLNVPFFRGNSVHDSSSKRDSDQSLHTDAVRHSHVFGSSNELEFPGDGDLDVEDHSSGEL